ncbi:hypothetical protein ABT124_05250 [Streptomyces sp. NPDC001982]|uniref:hypothetical protein n=1 Tax=unclassified Streptomyces TaxID=2593676 RepID=UPI0033236733
MSGGEIGDPDVCIMAAFDEHLPEHVKLAVQLDEADLLDPKKSEHTRLERLRSTWLSEVLLWCEIGVAGATTAKAPPPVGNRETGPNSP